MVDARLDEAVSFARAIVNKIRENMGTAQNLQESKALTLMYNTSTMLEDIAEMLERARCLAADNVIKTGGGTVARFCATWQLVETNGRLLLTRTKPATAIAYDGSKLVFRRGDVLLEATPGRVKVCRNKLCLEYDPTNKEQVIPIIPELTYVLRHLMNATRKSREALIVCAKFNKPSCLAI
ncbi:hypothetical protein Pyrfu_0862 [Pyrolobus fumarii 1A]|uniref:Uncharacterized protein n=1 Tax=Pyrolobus fumarii (strain DSM 11204 / 1A) TaxID=694429 RepID=G0EDW2_PYRF1|nr:hypothetical protein [Pyrolobus fumarii]AEM38731.1 hypothetical protein Pyrfu_0862 [Pyrolobus fumarii 1A]